MVLFNDDGIPLNLITVLLLFLMPNFAFIILTAFMPYLVHVSKNHPRLNRMLGELCNFFFKRCIRSYY